MVASSKTRFRVSNLLLRNLFFHVLLLWTYLYVKRFALIISSSNAALAFDSKSLALWVQHQSNMATEEIQSHPLCFLAGDLLAGQVAISDLVHHHQGGKEGQQEEGPPCHPFNGGLEPVWEHGWHYGHCGQQVDHQAAGGVVQLQPLRRWGQTQQLGEDHADTAGRLEHSGSHCADAHQAVPGDQVGTLRHILAGHHEAKTSSRSYQDQSLAEPVETDFTLPRFKAEGGSFGWEEKDAFSHAQAVLEEDEKKEMW